jgi:hypothetical protein
MYLKGLPMCPMTSSIEIANSCIFRHMQCIMYQSRHVSQIWLSWSPGLRSQSSLWDQTVSYISSICLRALPGVVAVLGRVKQKEQIKVKNYIQCRRE